MPCNSISPSIRHSDLINPGGKTLPVMLDLNLLSDGNFGLRDLGFTGGIATQSGMFEDPAVGSIFNVIEYRDVPGIGGDVYTVDVAGTKAADIINLQPLADLIHGTGFFGPDLFMVVNSGHGHDTITGSDLGEAINAGNGNDIVDGLGGDDLISGGRGRDMLSGGDGDDVIDGGKGKDTLDGGEGNDTLNGGAGKDILDGGEGNDVMAGGDARDTLIGSAGADTIDGGAGNDIIFGGFSGEAPEGAGRDGADHLFGGLGNDRIDGGTGRDMLDGGAGDDILTGGRGADVFVFGTGGDVETGFDIITDFRSRGRNADQIDLRDLDTLSRIEINEFSGGAEIELLDASGEEIGTISVRGQIEEINEANSYGIGSGELIRVNAGVEISLDVDMIAGGGSFVV